MATSTKSPLSRMTWKQIGAVLGVIATVIAIITGGMAIVQSLQNHTDRFTGDVTRRAVADDLVRFATSHDAKVVWLDLTCVDPHNTCTPPLSENAAAVILAVHATAAEYWFRIDTAGSDAEADNGSFGAGNLVVKGYFEVSVRGVRGDAPPDVQNVMLKGVDSSTVKG